MRDVPDSRSFAARFDYASYYFRIRVRETLGWQLAFAASNVSHVGCRKELDLLQKARFFIEEMLHLGRSIRLGDRAARAPSAQIGMLESRVLFSATPVAAVVDGIDPQECIDGECEPVSNAIGQQGADSQLQSVRSTASRTEIAIVDSAVAGYEQLIDDLIANGDEDREFVVFILDAEKDGVEQVGDILSGYSDLDAIHLVSHGTDGRLRLGNTWLDDTNIDARAGEIVSWNSSLSTDADLLIYGCDLAASDAGRELIESLGALCDCDVAASDDLTGHEALGGDWDLEVAIGTVDVGVAFSDSLQQSWLATLDITSNLIVHNTFDVNADDSSGNNNDGSLENGASIDTNGPTNNVGDGKLLLDGSDDFVELSPYVGDFQSEGEGTIAGWVRHSGGGYQTIFEVSDSGDTDSRVVLAVNSGELDFGVFNNGTQHIDVTSTGAQIPANTWTHVAVTVDATGNKLYVNGSQIGGLSYGSGSAASTEFFDDVTGLDFASWGRSKHITSQYRQEFNGFIDDARVYSRALTAIEIGDLYAYLPAEIVVTTTDDVVDAPNLTSVAALLTDNGTDGFISLREAIIAVNAGTGGDTIDLGVGTYTLSIGGAGEDAATTGDLDILQNVTITGAGAGITTIDASLLTGGDADRVLNLLNNADVTITGVTITGGSLGDGAGISVEGGASLTMNESMIAGNNAGGGKGGGLYNDDGVVVLTDVTIAGNSAAGNTGGGIRNEGTMTLNGVTVSGNTAEDGGGIVSRTNGSLLTMINTTVSGNTATNKGGGLETNRDVNITNSTIAFNTGENGAGINGTGGTVTIVNSILANNMRADMTPENAVGVLTSSGYNIDSDGTAGFGGTGDQQVDPLLDSLASNGGFTQTHALLAGSAAINAANSGAAPATDQRGAARVGLADIGAFEFGGLNSPPAASNDSALTQQDTAVVIDWLTNDSDTDGDSLSVFDFSNPSDGSVVDNGDGTFTYTPDPGYYGLDSFDYVVTDGNDGTSHYWKLDGNAVDSVGASDGTLTGPTTVDGYYGDALSFDETNDRVVIPDVAYNSDFTLSVRFKVDDNTGSVYQYFYSHGASETPDSLNVYIVEASGSDGPNMLRTNIRDGNDGADRFGLDVDISSLIGDGQWHTYTLTVESGVGAKVYIDGSQENSSTNGDDGLDPSGNLFLGAREDLQANRFYGGALDSVQIIDHTLAGSDVADLHSGGSSRASVNVTVNGAPTLTTLANPVDTTSKDMEVEVTFVDLTTAGDENDVDGTVDRFVVKAVSTGTLRIGVDAGSATAWAASSNDTIDSSNNAYWTPDFDVSDTQNAFQVVAKDNGGLESATNVTAQIYVTADNDAPVNSVPGGQSMVENGTLTFSSGNGNLISISDADAGSGDIEVTISVNDGTFTLFQTNGLSFVVGDGDSDAMTTFTGSQTDINLALDGLQYSPTPAWSGTETLTITTKDQASTLDVAPTTKYTFNVDGTDVIGSNDATLNNGAAVVADSERGNVLETDGVNAYARVPAAATSGLSEFSFSFWVKTTESGSATNYWERPTLVGMEIFGFGADDFVVNTNNGFIGFFTGLSGPADEVYLSTTTQINDNHWHQITVSNDGANASLYVDGVIEATLATGDALANPAFFLGAQSNSGSPARRHSGDFDDFRFFDRALTTQELTDIHGLTDTDSVAITVNGVPTADAGGTYNVDEGSTVSLDASGSDDPDGTITQYEWDFDYTGAFTTDASSATSSITFDASSIDGPAVRTVALRVTDNASAVSSIVTTTVTVNNVAPTGAADTGAAFTTNEETAFTTGDATANDTDPAGLNDDLTITALDTTGTVGLVTINADGKSFGYDPNGQFENLALGQSTTDVFTYTVSDGDSGSDTSTVTITINGANDAPVLTAIEGGSLAYAEGDGAVAVTGTLAVGDVDDADIESAVIQVTGNYVNGEDFLTFTNTANITGVFDTLTGTLTLSGSDTITAYETAIRSVAYQNNSEDPSGSTRTVSILVSDGNDPSNTVTRDIDVTAVNDRPVIADLTGDLLNYGQGAGSIVIDQGIAATVADVDSGNFGTGNLIVSIVAGSDVTEDVLSIRDEGAGVGEIGFDGLNVTFEGATIGTAVGGAAGADLVITFNASATPTNVSTLINHITYENTDAVVPTLGARTVRFVVNDGDGGVSVSHDTTVQVNAEMAPTISDLDGDSFAYTEGSGPLAIDQGTAATVADADSADFENGTLTVVFASGSDPAEDELSILDQGAGVGNIQIAGANVSYDFGTGPTVIGSFTGGTSGAPLVVTFNANATPVAVTQLVHVLTFENTDAVAATTGSRTIHVSLTDGDGGTSMTHDVLVNVVGVNSASVLSGIEGAGLAYGTSSGPVAVTGSLAVADVDDTNIESATIQVSSGYVNGEDVLAFTNTANITGVFNATTATLTLTGTDTIAAYQAAIRSVTYENVSGSPTYGSRTVSFTVNDGDDPSNTSTRSVTVTNQSPTGVADTYSMTQNTTLTETPSGVLANDSDPEGDSLTAVLDSGPGHASAFSLGADGSFTYTPTIGFVGADSFTYRAHDGTSASSATTVTINVSANAAPTVVLVNKTTSLDEDIDTTSSMKVADIVVSDDGIGTNTLSLLGADASWFEIVSGNELHLRAGVSLDYETNWTLDVTVAVDDASLPGGAEDTYSQAIAIEDVNEAPTLLIVSAVDSISQASSSVVVAEFAIEDDALGEERIVLLGEHASFFEVVGNSVVLRANANAELADVAQLELTVGLDDLSTSASPDQSIELSFNRAIIAPAPLSSAETSNSTQSSEAEADEEAPATLLVESVVGAGTSSSDSESRFRSTIEEPSEVVKVGPQESTASAVNADPEVKPTSVFRTAKYTSSTSGARVSSVDAFTSQSSIADLAFASNPGVFWTELDAFQETVSTYSTGAIAIGSVSVASSGVTVGYVAWILRGGALMSSLMASLPVWRFMDPMVIISQVGDEDDEDSGSLESIMDRELAESSGSESLPHNDYVSTGQAESTAAKAME